MITHKGLQRSAMVCYDLYCSYCAILLISTAWMLILVTFCYKTFQIAPSHIKCWVDATGWVYSECLHYIYWLWFWPWSLRGRLISTLIPGVDIALLCILWLHCYSPTVLNWNYRIPFLDIYFQQHTRHTILSLRCWSKLSRMNSKVS